jgi:hypothetical protein
MSSFGPSGLGYRRPCEMKDPAPLFLCGSSSTSTIIRRKWLLAGNEFIGSFYVSFNCFHVGMSAATAEGNPYAESNPVARLQSAIAFLLFGNGLSTSWQKSPPFVAVSREGKEKNSQNLREEATCR